MPGIVGFPSDFGRQLLEALGLQGRGVRSIQINVAVNSAVTADVTFVVRDKEAALVADIIKKYQLVEKTEKAA